MQIRVGGIQFTLVVQAPFCHLVLKDANSIVNRRRFCFRLVGVTRHGLCRPRPLRVKNLTVNVNCGEGYDWKAPE